MKYRSILGSVSMIGPPRLICFLNNGTTLPWLPSTFPNLTHTKTQFRPARAAFSLASCTSFSPTRLLAPITEVGLTALSVDTDIRDNFN